MAICGIQIAANLRHTLILVLLLLQNKILQSILTGIIQTECSLKALCLVVAEAVWCLWFTNHSTGASAFTLPQPWVQKLLPQPLGKLEKCAEIHLLCCLLWDIILEIKST